jgi:hypothetical protein
MIVAEGIGNEAGIEGLSPCLFVSVVIARRLYATST